MPSLKFQLKKRTDAKAQLVLTREDGSHTSSAIGPADGFFPIHDLTHYAIETTLGLDEGFLGLCSSGWEISDFEVKGTAAKLPREAIFAEVAAGELSRQLATRQVSSLEDFLWAIGLTLGEPGAGYRWPAITEAQFMEIIERIRAESARWREILPGGMLELTYTSRRKSDCAAPTPAERKAGKLATR